jgi:two-component system sensor histidine kinase QseC
MRSLSRQLILGLLGTLLVLLVGFCLATVWTVRGSLYEQFDDNLRTRATVLMRFSEQRSGVVRFTLPKWVQGRLWLEQLDVPTVTYFQIWGANNDPVARSQSLGEANLPLRHGVKFEPEFWNLVLPNGNPGRAIGVRFRPRFDRDDPALGPAVDAVVVLAADRTGLDHAFERQEWMLVICSAVLLGGVAVAVPLVLRRSLRPLQRVTEQAARINAESLSERFPTEHLPAELAPIAECLNHLLARLESSFERERRFGADVSHELLTPLTELRALGEYALRYPDTDSRQGWKQALEILRKMESIIVCLVDLSRAERGAQLVNLGPIDLARLLQTVWAPLAELVNQRGLRLELNIPPGTLVLSDDTVLRSIVQNLLSNAVNYADEDGAVQVSAMCDNGVVRLQVTNPASSLAAGDLPHLFERFWRKDASRSGGGHGGLGLSLARELARLLGCELVAMQAGEQTVTMSLEGLRPATTASASPAP